MVTRRRATDVKGVEVRGALAHTGVVLLGALVLVGGCIFRSADEGGAAMLVTNDSGHSIDLQYFDDRATKDGDVIYRGVGPHSAVSIDDAFRADICMSGVIIASDATSGDEIARRTGPICLPAEWVIPAE